MSKLINSNSLIDKVSKEIEEVKQYNMPQLVMGMNKVKEMIQNEQEYINDGWIPCDVKMPDNDDYVLVTLKSDDGEIFTDESTAYYDEKLWRWRWSDDCTLIENDVLAWQPLPKPYKCHYPKV